MATSPPLDQSRRMSLRTLTRRPRHAALFWSLVALTALVKRLPISWVQRLGSCLGTSLAWLSSALRLPISRHTARRISRLGLREGSPELEAVVAGAWRDLGRRALEWLKEGEALKLVELSPEVQRWCLRARGGELRLICLSAHLGHWELMAAKLSSEGVPFVSAAAAERSGPVGRWVTARRAALGVQTMRPQASLSALSSFIRSGGVRAFLIDLPSRGATARALPFLGDPAPVLTLPSRLIARSRARGETHVLWLYSLREADGRYWVYAEDLSAEEDPVYVAHQRLEEVIQRAPTQWLWLSDRWREGG